MVAVDADVDITRDEEVLWALATHFQPDRDMIVIDGLPGSALDPSADKRGTTSRLALDATRGQGFDAQRIEISASARAIGRQIARRPSPPAAGTSHRDGPQPAEGRSSPDRPAGRTAS